MFSVSFRKLVTRLAMLACVLAGPVSRPASVQGADKGNALARRAPHYVGVQSCAAANCHGGGGGREAWSSSYSTWVQKDRHARAYTALFNQRSQRMVKILGWDSTAWQSQVCLNCHSLPPQGSDHVVRNPDQASDGVSCEACHGSASLWLKSHRHPDWRKSLPQPKLAVELGFVDTENIQARARVCAGCHVGAPGRDVNHDLIAAGHPRLSFELANYHSRLPAHWDEAADRRRHVGEGTREDGSLRELKLWAIGQVESMRARAVLVGWRASRACDDQAPWPEFAETACFACHHDLHDARWRRGPFGTTAATIRGRGPLPWASWERAVLLPLSRLGTGRNEAAKVFGELGKFEETIRPKTVPLGTVVSQAQRLQLELEAWSNRLNDRSWSVKDLDGLARFLVGREEGSPVHPLIQTGWDSSAQLFLGLSALQQARREAVDSRLDSQRSRDEALEVVLSQMRRQLQFPDGFNSPGQLRRGSGGVELPASLIEIDEALKQLQATLNNE